MLELELRLNGGRKTVAIETRGYKTYAEWRTSDECKEWEKQRETEYTKWLADNNNNNKSSQQNTNNNTVQVKIRSKYHIINKDTKKVMNSSLNSHQQTISI